MLSEGVGYTHFFLAWFGLRSGGGGKFDGVGRLEPLLGKRRKGEGVQGVSESERRGWRKKTAK